MALNVLGVKQAKAKNKRYTISDEKGLHLESQGRLFHNMYNRA